MYVVQILYIYQTRVRGITLSTPAQHGRLWVLCSAMLGLNSCTYCYYVRCATLIVQIWGVPWPQTGPTQYHAKLRPPAKGRSIKGLVICYVVLLGSMIFGIGLLTSTWCSLVPCCGQDGYRAQFPHQHPIDSYRSYIYQNSIKAL